MTTIQKKKGKAFAPLSAPAARKEMPPVHSRRSYILLLSGILVIATGLIIMASDTEPYGYGLAGITIGPVVLFAGLMIPFFSIFSTKSV